jgi:hypothetical protein
MVPPRSIIISRMASMTGNKLNKKTPIKIVLLEVSAGQPVVECRVPVMSNNEIKSITAEIMLIFGVNGQKR